MAAQTQDPLTSTREHPRFTVNSRVRLHWTDFSNDDDVACSCEGVCTDVAVGGIGLYTASDFAPGDVVGVEFIDSQLPIYPARVVYRNGYDYGLQFLEVV